MFKKLFIFLVALSASLAFAASIDLNKASNEELHAIKGIGPVISSKIIEERQKSNFKDWGDFINRVNGIGLVNAEKFSNEGLTIDGHAFKAAKPTTPTEPTTQAAPTTQTDTPAKNTKKNKKAAAAKIETESVESNTTAAPESTTTKTKK